MNTSSVWSMQCDIRNWCNFKIKNSDQQKGGIQCKEASKKSIRMHDTGWKQRSDEKRTSFGRKE